MTLHKNLDLIKSHQKSAPVKVVPIAEELGLKVFRASDWDKNLSGMIKKMGEGKYNIYVNASHHILRRQFTIAHEIAHFILHRGEIGDGVVDDALYRSGLSNKQEAQANRLAAQILMPWHLLEKEINSGINDFEELARKFNVSKSSMSIRLGVPFE